MTTKTTAPETLTAERTDDGWRVRDANGGVWYPDTTAERAIESAPDPAACAVDICRRSPMRGTWHP